MDRNNKFREQLIDVCQSYPNLKIVKRDDNVFLKGILDIPNSQGDLINSFLIEIHQTDLFPYRFPKLYEVGDLIPCDVDWHKYSDNSCCITVPPEEIILCKDGITVIQFITRHAIPYFANQCYRMITGSYKAEYAHGKQGFLEFYADLMGTTDISKWYLYMEYAFENNRLKFERNISCFCGSGVKFKKCHDRIFDKMRVIGKDTLANHFRMLSKII